MKRRLLIIAVVLLAGAVLNVAVAWGCALALDPMKGRETNGIASTTREWWMVARITRLGVTIVISTRGAPTARVDPPPRGPEPRSLLPSFADLAEPLDEFRAGAKAGLNRVIENRAVYACGWPVRSLWCDLYRVHGPQVLGALTRTPGHGFFETSLPRWQAMIPRVLPWQPIWIGFAVDTGIFALVLWLLVRGPFVARQLLRIKRGRCPVCGYPAGGAPQCTECGQGRPRRARAMP